MPKEMIRQCKEYIEDRLGKPIDEKTLDEAGSGLMKNLCIKEINTYDMIAQALGIKKLIRSQNIYYNINIPTENGNEQWTIILSKYVSHEFESKYGSKYHISKPYAKHGYSIKEEVQPNID